MCTDALSIPQCQVFNGSSMLVSASAGVGRTGVFIALSITLERMRFEGVVDLFQTVKTLRTQRPAMVQTEVRDATNGIERCVRWLPLSLSLFLGPVPAVLPICSGIPGKLWSLCNINSPGKAPKDCSGISWILSPRLHPSAMRRRVKTAAGTGSEPVHRPWRAGPALVLRRCYLSRIKTGEKLTIDTESCLFHHPSPLNICLLRTAKKYFFYLNLYLTRYYLVMNLMLILAILSCVS